MELGALAARIEVFRNRLGELHDLGPIGVEPNELLDRLSSALEELEAAHEQLRADGEALADAHRDADVLRRENEELWQKVPFAQILTSGDLRILRVNGGSEKLFEQPSEKLVAYALPLLVAREERERFRELAEAVRRERTDLRSWDVVLDGSRRRVVTVWVTLMKSGFGEPEKLRWVLEDVTERRAREDALQKASRALEARLDAETPAAALIDVRRRSASVG